jgi:tetratricopeptide (TPR) repeat protein
LNPNYASAHKWYANYLSALFRSDEALAEYKKAQQLEPLSLIIGANLAEAYLGRNDAAAAEAQCHRTIEMDPNWFYIRELLSLAYLKQGRKDLALAEAQKAVELAKRGSYALGALGYIDSQVGKRDEALALANELKERYAKQQASGQDIARIYLGLGDKDQTFEWLEKDFQSHSSTLSSWLNFAPFDSLVDEPRYRDLLKRMGIPK